MVYKIMLSENGVTIISFLEKKADINKYSNQEWDQI